MKVLAINKSFVPIKTTSRYNAISKLFTGMANAIYFEGNIMIEKSWDEWVKLSLTDKWPENQDFIYATNFRVAIPKVIRYVNYDRIPRVTHRLSRQAIYNRDNYTCYICGERFGEGKLSIDHIKPLSKGGRNDWENMITCCKKHNYEKGDKLLHELGWKPKFAAYKPVTSNIQRLKASISPSSYQKEWALFGLS